ncbi:MAG: hypothetical protein K2X32_13665, partial [Phycisphaerales bacterium]|nr:hypothetical protein [Phycisphaerales bacterium]
MRRFNQKAVLTAACLGLIAPSVFAVDFPEVEPNDTKSTPNVRTLAPGDSVSGSTTGTSTLTAGLTSSDNFDITTTAAPTPGIWRYRLTITNTGTAGHTGSLRGVSQSATGLGAFTTDSAVQSSSSSTVPARINQWYANENASRVIYRVAGTGTTTGTYTSTLSRDPVTPTVIPDTISAGNITFSSIGQTATDTEFWIYDSNFVAIADAGNDDESIASGGTGGTLQSRFTRVLAPGTYFLTVSRINFANNLASPADDDFRLGAVLDFPNATSVSSTIATATDLDYVITHSGGTVPI